MSNFDENDKWADEVLNPASLKPISLRALTVALQAIVDRTAFLQDAVSYGVVVTPDAPDDDTPYIRRNNTWVPLVADDNVTISFSNDKLVVSAEDIGFEDAPDDDHPYVRVDGAWMPLEVGDNVTLTIVEDSYVIDAVVDEAPDGDPHVRVDGEWLKLIAGDDITFDLGTEGELTVNVNSEE